MLTIGVDLAAAPRNTAACKVRWICGAAVVERVDAVVDDGVFHSLLESLREGDRLGIDCPLGWPVAFTAAVLAHEDRRRWPAQAPPGDRSDLVWRATDRWVGRTTGRWPLSVSTDRIGVTAMRAAYLLDAWEATHGRIDRSGMTGPVVEVYPAAARRAWDLGAVRSVAEIEAQLPLSFSRPPDRKTCETSEHAFDALVAALAARAAAIGLTDGPPTEDVAHAAATEGWIHVPSCALADLGRA